MAGVCKMPIAPPVPTQCHDGPAQHMELFAIELDLAALAKLFGRTEASIKEGIRRGAPWLPKSFNMGSRHCWLKEDVRKFLRDFRDGKIRRRSLAARGNP